MLLRAAGLVVLLAIVLLAIELLVPGASRRLDAADPAWLVVAVALEGVALAGCVALFHATFGRRPHGLTLRRSAQIALGELAGFALVPTGAGGPVVRLWALRGGGMPWRDIGVRSVVHAALFNIPYLGAAVALGLGALLGILPGSVSTLVALAPLGVVLVSVAAVLSAVAARRAAGAKPRKRSTSKRTTAKLSKTGRFTVRHRYKKGRRFTLHVKATDTAGNKRTKKIHARVLKKRAATYRGLSP